MSFKGFTYFTKYSEPKKTLNGFYGFKVTLDLTGIKIMDTRGKGLSNVEVIAENPTSGNPFTGYTDSKGTVFMELDASTPIQLIKNQIIVDTTYNGELSPTYILDIPIIK